VTKLIAENSVAVQVAPKGRVVPLTVMIGASRRIASDRLSAI